MLFRSQHLQLIPVRHVEEPARRDVVDADAVGVEFPDQCKIFFHPLRLREGVATGSRLEWPVSHAFRKEFLRPNAEKLAVGYHAFGWRHVREINRQLRLAPGNRLIVRHAWFVFEDTAKSLKLDSFVCSKSQSYRQLAVNSVVIHALLGQ